MASDPETRARRWTLFPCPDYPDEHGWKPWSGHCQWCHAVLEPVEVMPVADAPSHGFKLDRGERYVILQGLARLSSGFAREIAERLKATECPACHGGGYAPYVGGDDDDAPCLKCGGTGFEVVADALPLEGHALVERCAKAYCEYEGYSWEQIAEEPPPTPRGQEDARNYRCDYRRVALAILRAAGGHAAE